MINNWLNGKTFKNLGNILTSTCKMKITIYDVLFFLIWLHNTNNKLNSCFLFMNDNNDIDLLITVDPIAIS